MPIEITDENKESIGKINKKRFELHSKMEILKKAVKNRQNIKRALKDLKGVVITLINILNEGGNNSLFNKAYTYEQNYMASKRLLGWKFQGNDNGNAHGGTRKRTSDRKKTLKSKATKKDLQMLAKKYMVSPNGSTNDIANTLVELRGAAIKNKKERSIIEQFLKKSTPSTKRWGFVPLR
jgi:hypothetical protein